MWFKKKDKQKMLMEKVLNQAKKSSDFTSFTYKAGNKVYRISYVRTLVDTQQIHQDLMPYLHEPVSQFEDLKNVIPIENIQMTEDPGLVTKKYLQGHVIIQEENEAACILVNTRVTKGRQITTSEVEFSVVGPKVGFVEDIQTNIHLIRNRLPIPQLTIKRLTIGKVTKTKVAVCFIDGIATKENVNTVIQRLSDIEFDAINDTSMLMEMISDNSFTLFPIMINTERPDRVSAVLAEGKICIVCDGSPQVLQAPTTITEFFSSLEDYYINWMLASAFRLIRLFGVIFSVFATPLYVAVLTYHFEMVPKDLLATLISSRSQIPFPPILEVIFLELAIELLREAGARLPTKVGQTLGIVGGIVIGQASVAAGMTSNILLIVIALSALASFTTPIYKMANTIRLIRFPFILFAQLWGLIGIMLGVAFLLTHLIKLKSLGRPYLEPVYPLRLSDVTDSWLRFPYSQLTKRPASNRPDDKNRFNKRRGQHKSDIDED